MIIQDGRTSNTAKVNDGNALLTISKTLSLEAVETVNGQSFNINTGDIALTSADESAVLYIKNTDTVAFFIPSFVFLLGASTNGSGDWLTSIDGGTIAGTIVSGASSVSAVNRNIGSSRTVTGLFYKGAEGNTATGGTTVYSSRLASNGRVVVAADTVLQPGSALAVFITPPASNTSATIQVAVPLYRRTEDI